MRLTVAICPDSTMIYPEGAGHLWAYLSWAVALRDLGVEIVWVEGVLPGRSADHATAAREHRERLARLGIETEIALFAWNGDELDEVDGCVPLERVHEADLLLNFSYGMPASVVDACRRSALVDIDPGLLQRWMAAGEIQVAQYDVYFTIGETVGTQAARFPDCGIRWHRVARPVHLAAWPFVPAPPDAPYTTVSHWWGDEWMAINGTMFNNDKRSGFLDYLDLPAATSARLELALLTDDADEIAGLERRGWRFRNAWDVARTPEAYRDYIVGSRGEFSCAKPSCRLLANAWISDRTLCYLASGRPAIVEHTGESRLLPDREGLFRFRSPAEAAQALEQVEADYDRHARAARALAEEHFDAVRILRGVLETALA